MYVHIDSHLSDLLSSTESRLVPSTLGVYAFIYVHVYVNVILFPTCASLQADGDYAGYDIHTCIYVCMHIHAVIAVYGHAYDMYHDVSIIHTRI